MLILKVYILSLLNFTAGYHSNICNNNPERNEGIWCRLSPMLWDMACFFIMAEVEQSFHIVSPCVHSIVTKGANIRACWIQKVPTFEHAEYSPWWDGLRFYALDNNLLLSPGRKVVSTTIHYAPSPQCCLYTWSGGQFITLNSFTNNLHFSVSSIRDFNTSDHCDNSSLSCLSCLIRHLNVCLSSHLCH